MFHNISQFFFNNMVNSTAEVCALFFTKLSETDKVQLFQCSCGTQRKQNKGSGYANLMSHLKDKHDDWEELYNNFKKSNPKSKKAPSGHVFFVNPKVIQLHSWLNLVTSLNLPLCAVENPELRDCSQWESISEDTLSKYLRLVEAKIDENLKKELPKQFGIVIDGWSEGTTHYYGVFAAYSKEGRNYQRFLSISPGMDETSFTAKDQADYIVDVVELLDRQKSEILFLVADNTNTNPATAEILGVPFIGCASHRFNLAVQRYLQKYDTVLNDINEMMKSLKNLKMAGKLRQHTDLEPVTMNVTRWSSKFSMVERC
jgi:hypothetical protein